jgi:hypothetical protein
MGWRQKLSSVDQSVDRRSLDALLMALAITLLAALVPSPIRAQKSPILDEQALRRLFVSECMGARADTATLTFCNCSFSNLLGRYGLRSLAQQDSIVRASNAKDLVALARLAWEPEFKGCRSK